MRAADNSPTVPHRMLNALYGFHTEAVVVTYAHRSRSTDMNCVGTLTPTNA